MWTAAASAPDPAHTVKTKGDRASARWPFSRRLTRSAQLRHSARTVTCGEAGVTDGHAPLVMPRAIVRATAMNAPLHSVLVDLEPVVARELARHLDVAREWMPHEYVPW